MSLTPGLPDDPLRLTIPAIGARQAAAGSWVRGWIVICTANWRTPLQRGVTDKPINYRNYLMLQPTFKNWLGDLDSNQGCPGQSREFYR